MACFVACEARSGDIVYVNMDMVRSMLPSERGGCTIRWIDAGVDPLRVTNDAEELAQRANAK
jgi:hypothetical protein